MGKISVVARGNSGDNQIVYPACFNDDWVLNVGGNQEDGIKYINSSYGEGIDVLAPYKSLFNYTTNTGGGYSTGQGTSYSAAYVTGLTGLLLSYMNNTNGLPDPINLAPEDVEEITQRTTFFDVVEYNPPYDDRCGWGRVDMGAALNMVDKNYSRLLHFNSYANTLSSISNTKVSGSTDIDITLKEPVVGTNIPAGTYKAEVWKSEQVVQHNITLLPNETIQGFWARSGASSSFPYYTTTGGTNYLDPYVKAYVDDDPLPNASTATIWGYYYRLKQYSNPTIEVGWVPQDPNDIQPKLSYTIYTRSSTPTAVNELSNDINANVFPNPSSGNFQLTLQSSRREFFSVKMYDNLGQFVQTLYEGNTLSFSEVYAADNLPNGMYLITIQAPTSKRDLKLCILN